MLKYFLLTSAISFLETTWIEEIHRKQANRRFVEISEFLFWLLSGIIFPAIILLALHFSDEINAPHIHKQAVYYFRVQLLDCVVTFCIQMFHPDSADLKILRKALMYLLMGIITCSSLYHIVNISPLRYLLALEQQLSAHTYDVLSVFAANLLLVWKKPRIEIDARPQPGDFRHVAAVILTLGLILVIDAFAVLLAATHYYAPYALCALFYALHFFLPVPCFVHLCIVYILLIDCVDRMLVWVGGAIPQRVIRPPTQQRLEVPRVRARDRHRRQQPADAEEARRQEQEEWAEWVEDLAAACEWGKFWPPVFWAGALLCWGLYEGLGALLTLLFGLFA